MSLAGLRKQYHERLCSDIIRVSSDDELIAYPNLADGSNKASRQFGKELVKRLGCRPVVGSIPPQTIGILFENATCDFIESAFNLLTHLRPGPWLYAVNRLITAFDQYEHLAYLAKILSQDNRLASTLGSDYIVKPDVVVGRYPATDEEINLNGLVVDDNPLVATLSPLRKANREPAYPILHASISCKWTLRNDRSQNARTEALNLIRNRKGNLPHVATVTAEPLPTRISALALGTGDLDCVYHVALHELLDVITASGNEDQLEVLDMLIEGRRLRDISDLPLDLAI